MKKTLLDYKFNGSEALEHILSTSPYGGLEQAVASLTLFSHPETVMQTNGCALFRIVRGNPRGTIKPHPDGSQVLLDDNTGPTDAFLWSNRISRSHYRDVQFCHVWPASQDPCSYTNLANICLLPAFLAKLSDTHPLITKLLRWRAGELFKWCPVGESPVVDDLQFRRLEWAPALPATPNLANALRKEMSTKPKSRTTKSAREIGWIFSDWKPDEKLPTGI